MKKIYSLLMVAAVALSANAANFTLTVDGQPVQDGDRIDLNSTFKYGEVFGWGYYPHVVMTPSVDGHATATFDFYKDNTTPKMDEEFEYGCNMGLNTCAFGLCSTVYGGGKLTKEGNVNAGQEYDYEMELVMELGTYQNKDEVKVDCEFSIETTLNGESMKVTFYAGNQGGGIEGLGVDAEQPAVFYDLQGRRVVNPTNGLYICKQGGKTTKVIF